jgi:hypothetical protein
MCFLLGVTENCAMQHVVQVVMDALDNYALDDDEPKDRIYKKCTKLLSTSISNEDAADIFFGIFGCPEESKISPLWYFHEALYNFCHGYVKRSKHKQLEVGKSVPHPLSYLLVFEPKHEDVVGQSDEIKAHLYKKVSLAQVCHDARFGKVYNRLAEQFIRKIPVSASSFELKLRRAVFDQLSLDTLITLCAESGYTNLEAYDYEQSVALHAYVFPQKNNNPDQ